MHDRTKARPADAEIVVVGGGMGGCSAAYHLAALGKTDVLLLERANLSSGTTPTENACRLPAVPPIWQAMLEHRRTGVGPL
jgi:choline dehydrogenase-like flavoprotein